VTIVARLIAPAITLAFGLGFGLGFPPGVLAEREAMAHPEFSPVVVNRYVKVTLLSPDEVRLAYTVMFGAAPAVRERKAADANADGVLDEAETRALGARLRSELVSGLKLEADGQRLEPVFDPAMVGLAGPEVGPSPFSVDLVTRLRLSHRDDHTLHFDDSTELPLLGETEVRVEESPSTRLIASHRGAPGGTERETRFLFRGPKFSALEDRSITIRFAGTIGSAGAVSFGGNVAARSSAAPSAHRSRPPALFFALLALLGVGLVVTFRVRRRK
jgi:hypothetical protein